MGLISDIRVLYHLAVSPIRGSSHAERLESFYSGQAADYDAFRKRLLHGREELYGAIHVPQGGVWVDMGGGTGANLESIPAEAHDALSKLYVVDLSHSLLEMAKQRIADRGWSHAKSCEHDVTTFVPEEGAADVVTFSYSLTMIPDWFAAIDQAYKILKPGGVIGVVDFYAARKYPAEGHRHHSWWTRTFWPTWFANDGVYLSPDHVPYLHRHFTPLSFTEHYAKVPYIPITRVPYYRFIGQKAE